eukprot:CAMPEP_0115164508 /NCGR_PEP_ID=MMETSP0227-20121206/73075_1 /TAXON_ID=89957 /ORGANISM="Polarella glacialis, Strain CCMP 1383" /LENGTH=191 /DNA_ID=CAMNT_0002576875 /DNA_START=71 /DNA_END=646 /DNA_ORIENTATION=+
MEALASSSALLQAASPGALALLSGSPLHIQRAERIAVYDTREASLVAALQAAEAPVGFALSATGLAGLFASAAAAVATRARRRRRASRQLAALLRIELGLETGNKECAAKPQVLDVETGFLEEPPLLSNASVGAGAIRMMEGDHSSWYQMASEAGKDALFIGASSDSSRASTRKEITATSETERTPVVSLV